MRAWDALTLRLRSLLRATRVERDLDDELRFHVEAQVEELVAKGMSPAPARTAALRAFGGVDQVKESVRDTWHVRAIRDLMQDLRYGVRVLTKAPAFTTVAVLTLALGIGATTAIFSVVDSLLLKPLHYPNADRIVRVLTHFNETNRDGENVSGGDLVDARDSGVFSAFSWVYGDEIGVRASGRSELVGTWFVNTGFFDVFGVKPVAGRTFRGDDVQKAAVISYGYAIDHYGSATAALGKVVSIDTRPYEVIGVMAPGFHFPRRAEVWVTEPSQPSNMNRTGHNYPIVARVRLGLSLETAKAMMATLSRRISTDHPDTNGKKGMVIMPLQERMVGNMRSTLYLLLGAVGVLFLIACANVANLLLARATVRTREMALRAALGADRWRIIRQLTVESLLLGATGGTLGLVLSYVGTALLVRVAPSDLPRLDEVHVDLTVLAFAAIAAVVASLLFGLVPAWHASRVNLRDPLTEGGSKGAVAGRSTRLRTALAVAEIGLAVVLAIGGGILFRSFMALSAVDLGYHTSDVLVIQANLPSTDDVKDQSRVIARYERLMPAIASVPGVQAAAATVGLPMGLLGSNGSFAVEGKHTFGPPFHDLPYGNFRLTTPGYFATIGTPLRRGRDFSAADTYDSPFVTIISEALARQVFPNEDPIGHRIQCGLDSPNFMTVVGIVGDIRDEPGTPPASELYMPLAQHPGRGALVQIVVRTSVPPATLTETIDARIRQADAEVAKKFTTFDHIAADSIATPRFRATLVGTFASLALLLAMAGVYGLLTYLTAQRLPELGVRMALGARPGTVMALVLRRAAVIGGIGLAIGLVLSLLSSRVLATMVFGLSPVDWTTYAVVGSAVLIVTLLAAFVPAWRASRIDPLTVLRQS